jgi:glycine cleavage system aminomethyltransferase T/glycine/D-amino acid oxidase-like deaminating enzyme
MKSHAQVVIIGGGVAGCSIAYHLTHMGWRDVLVVERGELSSGTTFHSAGLVGLLRSSVALTKMMMYSSELYGGLEAETGLNVGWRKVGSLRLASTPDRLLELKRQVSWARTFGLPLEMISAAEAQRLFPIMTTKGVLGAVYLPLDGYVDPSGLANALARGARQGGAEFATGVRVQCIHAVDGRARSVVTDQGEVRCEAVVNAAGIWAPHIGKLAGVTVPLIPMEHQYLTTKPLGGVSRNIPTMRDPDLLVYYRPEGSGGLVMGGYERNPAAWGLNGIPSDFNHKLLEPDADRFETIMANAIQRTPSIEKAEIVQMINGPEAFTPDGEFILGEAANVKGFFVAAGFCAHGIAGSGGIGRMMAEWIVEGRPSIDLWRMDIRRFGEHYASQEYTLERTLEIYRTYYDIHYPNEERESARKLRFSPVYQRLSELGAVFGEKAGWERPNYFERDDAGNTSVAEASPAAATAVNFSPEWRFLSHHNSAATAAEHRATRERAGLFDETSFSKIEVEGRGAAGFLQRLCDNDVDRPAGTVTYTQMLNEQGGIECDLTVTRLTAERFLIVSGSAFGAHDLDWIRSHAPGDGRAMVRDVTSSYACIGLWGPRARDILAGVTKAELSNEAFPYMSAKDITVGHLPVLALRVTYVGELGWEMYAPTEYGLALWDTLWQAGRPFGLAAAGYRAIESLRLEKGYRYWSTDITPEYNPYESGLGFCVRLNKGEFIGREALVTVNAQGGTRKLCCLTWGGEDDGVFAIGGEPILREGMVIGRVTSGGYGWTLQKAIAYGYLPIEHAAVGTPVQVEMFGERVDARVEREPLYDPKGAKIKG